MTGWDWLVKPRQTYTWGFALRVVFKAALLFVLVNLLFALLNPLEALGRLSLYNGLLPGRERLPYGENPAQSYNLSLFNIPAMFASHGISQPKPANEYRVVFIGDSATWGWYLENHHTLTGRINQRLHLTDDGRHIMAHNLGYPIMSLTKDLMILDEAMRHAPDMIVWLVTLESFPRDKQLFPPIVQQNPARVRALIQVYDLALNPDDARFMAADLWASTVIGQRRALADLLRLQVYGFSWAATRIDQFIPESYPPTARDFEADLSWEGYPAPHPLSPDILAFDVLQAGISRAGQVPVLIVNEPMFISDGENSALRYNFFYPRWAYDAYRALLIETATSAGWHFLDLWDALPPAEFTDSPVHTTPAGAAQLADLLLPEILQKANTP